MKNIRRQGTKRALQNLARKLEKYALACRLEVEEEDYPLSDVDEVERHFSLLLDVYKDQTCSN